MPFIQVHLLEGRTDEQREKLAKAITDAVVEILGVSKDVVWITFHDIPKHTGARAGSSEANDKYLLHSHASVWWCATKSTQTRQQECLRCISLYRTA